MSSAIISAEHGCHIISAGFGRCFLMPKQESTNTWKYVGPEWFDKLLYLSRTMGHTTIKATAYYYNLVPLFADQLNELSGSGLTEILPDLTDYYTNEEE